LKTKGTSQLLLASFQVAFEDNFHRAVEEC